MRESLKLSLAALVVVLLGALPVAAQTGRIGGLVKDDKGQPLKGATVVAENPAASPPSFTATTDDKGRFSIIGLRAGNWKLTASAPGFQPSVGQVPIRTIGAPEPAGRVHARRRRDRSRPGRWPASTPRNCRASWPPPKPR